MNSVNLIPALLKKITVYNIPKETLDCFLDVFTVTFLKSEEIFKRAVMLDLYDFVDFLLNNMQPFFLEKKFKCVFILFRIYQM
jgi:hypothetical protein